MISTAPLPSLAQLLTAPFRPLRGDRERAAPWLAHDDDHPYWFSRAAWALEDLAEAVALEQKRPAILWVPDFFCNQSLDPARRLLTTIVFYPVDANLDPDWAACEELAHEHPPELFLQVHYFGLERDLSRARSFCNAHGALLIEDAAHALRPEGEIGRQGDITLWSLYKHLPLPDGGLLISRKTTRILPHGGWPTPRPWWLKRLAQSLLPGLLGKLRPPALPPFGDDPEATRLPTTPQMSPLAGRVLMPLAGKLDAVAEARRRNRQAVEEALTRVPGVTAVTNGDSGNPYRAVFRAETPEIAETTYDALRARGLLVETWPDLPPEVRAEPERHKNALAWRKSLFMIPIHPPARPERLGKAYALS